MRTMAQKSPEALKLYTPSYLPDDPYAHFQFEPPSEKECQTKVRICRVHYLSLITLFEMVSSQSFRIM